jgi:exodeoxyribonuclease VII small subunit
MNTDTIAKPSLSFEDKLKQLETLLAGLETGELPLEEWMQTYVQGMQLLKSAQEQIKAVELQIEKLDFNGDTVSTISS